MSALAQHPFRGVALAVPAHPWRRTLVESFEFLRSRKACRRWAGGRWAHFAWVYNHDVRLGFRDALTMMDIAVAESGQKYGGFDHGRDCVDARWRAIEACPHMKRAVARMVTANRAEMHHVAVPCECEVWS